MGKDLWTPGQTCITFNNCRQHLVTIHRLYYSFLIQKKNSVYSFRLHSEIVVRGLENSSAVTLIP